MQKNIFEKLFRDDAQACLKRMRACVLVITWKVSHTKEIIKLDKKNRKQEKVRDKWKTKWHNEKIIKPYVDVKWCF